MFWVAGSLALSTGAWAGSARDYLNAPVDTSLASYGAGYTTSVTPEDGTDTVPGIRSNVFAQSIVLTRVMDYWGRTGGLSIVLPYAFNDTAAGPFRANTNGVSDVGFLWQMNFFGGPALTREQFQSFIPQTFSSFHLLNYLVDGAQTLSQKPILRLEEHLSRNLTDGLWLSLVVAKPAGEPDSQTLRFTLRQLW